VFGGQRAIFEVKLDELHRLRQHDFRLPTHPEHNPVAIGQQNLHVYKLSGIRLPHLLILGTTQ
jgi:hypothetical protein